MTPTPDFDRVARLYRWAEYLTLGPLLQRMRTHFLPRLAHCQRALVLGDGDGRFLTRLLRQNPRLFATAVDTSAVMLRLLRKRCQSPNLRTVQASALTVALPPRTDLIVTHFFLDCLTQPELDRLAITLAAATSPGALWLLSDFRIPEAGPLRPIARVYIRALYLAFRVLTNLRVTHLPNPQTALAAAGYVRLAGRQTLGGMLYTELWQRGGDTISSDAMSQTNLQPPAPHLAQDRVQDALPDPEPAVPSLPGPDPGVFHRDPAPETISSPSQK